MYVRHTGKARSARPSAGSPTKSLVRRQGRRAKEIRYLAGIESGSQGCWERRQDGAVSITERRKPPTHIERSSLSSWGSQLTTNRYETSTRSTAAWLRTPTSVRAEDERVGGRSSPAVDLFGSGRQKAYVRAPSVLTLEKLPLRRRPDLTDDRDIEPLSRNDWAVDENISAMLVRGPATSIIGDNCAVSE
jgi:hypothetical protein